MERMEKTWEVTRSNFNPVCTGRASPSLLDHVEVCWNSHDFL
jgi:ribosome recycling factor